MRRVLLLFSVFIITSISNSAKAQTPPWPEWVFHHWVWEDESTQHSALQLVNDYKAHDIPVGAIIIDSPWETGYNTFEWDTALYPDAQAMVDSFHANNVRVVVWATTAINTDVPELWHYADSMGYFMKANASSGSAVVNWWKGDGSMIDFFNPAAVAWWKTLMDKTLDLGIDGWKCDGTDYSILLGATYSPGVGRTVSRNEYSDAYYQLFHDYTRQKLGNDRINMSRPVDNYGTGITLASFITFTPRNICFACWVGDQDATFDGMKAALTNMYLSDVNNYLSFGSDIGGYRDESGIPNGRTKEVFLRWAQLGAFSPLMENGGGGEHRPWAWDSETNDVYRKFTMLHHAMIPYLMHQADSLFAVTQSLMQFFNNTDYRFMLGSDVFVAPVLSSSTFMNITFPSGGPWVYLFDNSKVYQGGATNGLNVPIGEYPVFIKSSSSLLGTLDSVIRSVTSIETVGSQNNTINLYPNPASAEIIISGLEFQGGEDYEFNIFDVVGRNILKTQLNSGNQNVSVEALENGVYYYSIEISNRHTSEKISGKVVIQK